MGFFVLGCATIFFAASFLLGTASQSDGLSCKAICVLARLVTEFFGEFAGRVFGGLLLFTVGAAFCIFDYKILR
jgi:hypothetical protein